MSAIRPASFRILTPEEVAAFDGPMIIDITAAGDAAHSVRPIYTSNGALAPLRYQDAPDQQPMAQFAPQPMLQHPVAAQDVRGQDLAPLAETGTPDFSLPFTASTGHATNERGPADSDPGASYTPITQETFYAGPDLNKIAETVRKNQQDGIARPTAPAGQLYTDRDGTLIAGDQLPTGSAGRATQITQETFYVSGFGSTGRSAEQLRQDRLERERVIVRQKLPSNTTFATDNTVDGWVYRIRNEFGDDYQLFLWFEVSSGTYRVSLLEPRLGGTVSAHECHLFQDGQLCLRREGGYTRLEEAYGRSVLWTRGASCYRRGHGFQFQVGQS